MPEWTVDELLDRLERAHDQAVELQGQNVALQNSLVLANQKCGQLAGQLTKLQRAEDVPGDVREVFVEWQWRCDFPNLSLVESRRKLIAARINEAGSSVEKCKRAIYGYSRFPFTGPKGRQATGSEGQRYVKLSTIFRDGEMVDNGVDLAVRADREDGGSRPGETPWPVDLFDPDEVVSPGPHDADRVPLWVVPCPGHGDGRTLRAGACMVRWGGNGQVRAGCLTGCGDVLQALERLRDGKPLDQMDLGSEMAA